MHSDQYADFVCHILHVFVDKYSWNLALSHLLKMRWFVKAIFSNYRSRTIIGIPLGLWVLKIATFILSLEVVDILLINLHELPWFNLCNIITTVCDGGSKKLSCTLRFVTGKLCGSPGRPNRLTLFHLNLFYSNSLLFSCSNPAFYFIFLSFSELRRVGSLMHRSFSYHSVV